MSTTQSHPAATQGRVHRSGAALRAWAASWRTVDLLTVAFLGVAFGVIFWAWALLYTGPANALTALYPPLSAIAAAPWLVAGIVGGLVVRRPGAALVTELIAATVELLLISQWGLLTIASGLFQGLGAEIALALLAYRSFGPRAAMLAGALAGAFEGVYEWFVYLPDFGWGTGEKVAYVVAFAAGGAVIAGLLSWALVKALASAGALNALPAGQEHRDRHAV